MNTLVAYVYDRATGLCSRCIVSDDYAIEKDLLKAHGLSGEDAVFSSYPGTFKKVVGSLPAMTDDAMQDAVTRAIGIEPPPKEKYARTDPDGLVVSVFETRRADDPRINRALVFRTADAAAGDTIIDGVLTKAPPVRVFVEPGKPDQADLVL